MVEIWRDIDGYNGLYQVSNLGRVKSVERYTKHNVSKICKRRERFLGSTNEYGYRVVGLYKDGKQKLYKVHRLVAQTFIPNPNNLPEINHINEIRNDNRVENLEWCDRDYNLHYGSCGKHLEQIKRLYNKL